MRIVNHLEKELLDQANDFLNDCRQVQFLFVRPSANLMILIEILGCKSAE